VVKELVCDRGNKGLIHFNDILNLVLNDYNMTTCVQNDYKMTTYFYFMCKSTHSCFEHNLTPFHIELFKQVISHDSNDQCHLIQYDYKSNCKHSCFFLKSY